MPRRKILVLTASAMLGASTMAHAASMTDQQMQQFMQKMSAQMQSMQTQMNGLQTEVKTLNTALQQEKAKNARLSKQVGAQSANSSINSNNNNSNPNPYAGTALGATPVQGNWRPASSTPTTPSLTQGGGSEQKASTGATLVSSNHSNLAQGAPPISEAFGPVFTSPYLGSNRAYDGSDLIINQSSVNLDVQLLKQRQQLANALANYGYQFPDHSLIELSGKVEAQGVINNQTPGSSSSDFNLATTELEAYAMINPCVSGFMSFAFDNTPSGASPNALNNSRIFLDQGFITLGNLNKTSFYGSMGQLYVPFGQYGSFMLSTPVTESLGRVQQRAMVFGYHPNEGFYASTYTFHNNTTGSGNGAGGGLDLGYALTDGNNDANVTVGVISNLAESQGMQSTGAPAGIPFAGFSEDAATEILHHQVPGLDFAGSADVGKFTLIGEYVMATREFSPLDLSFNNSGAKPTALHVEGVYHFNLLTKPGTFGLGYEHTSQALALMLPQQTFLAVFNISPWRDTVASLELRHGISYSQSDVASGAGSANFVAPDKDINTATFQFGIYF